MNNPASILSIVKASFGYMTAKERKILLSDIDLEISKPELIGLVGRNGSGKSTFLRTIVRLQFLLSGFLLLNGKNIRDYNRYELAKYISYVPTGGVENDTMTLRELVSLGRYPYTNWIGSLKKEDIEIIENSIKSTGIVHLADRKISEVSDGEKQRAMIARTLAQNTPLIILDEPTAFLDLPAKYELINLLYDLTRKGKTVIYSTHDLNIGLKFSDKLLIIESDHIHAGAPEDLILSGAVSRIFESDKIEFRQDIGDFDLKRTQDKIIGLSGNDDNVYKWTMQALLRHGFNVTQENSSPRRVELGKENGDFIWILHMENQILHHRSLYSLLSYLADHT